MKKILELISEEMQKAFEEAGYNKELGRVTVSNRPDLCEYQCNGAMAGAKQYKKAPIMIANDVVAKLADNTVFESVEAVMPGFLNLKVKPAFLKDYLQGMRTCYRFICLSSYVRILTFPFISFRSSFLLRISQVIFLFFVS